MNSNCVNWEAGQRLLINRSIDAAVFETSNHMILTDGLAYDKCSVGVVSDIYQDEDLREFFINDQDRLYNVVRTQVDTILSTGVAVLNADNPAVVKLAELCDGSVIFYSLDSTRDTIIKQRNSDERVVFTRDQCIVLAKGKAETALLPLASLKPTKAAQAENIMAAVAAAWALGISPDLIEAGLRTFESGPKKTYY